MLPPFPKHSNRGHYFRESVEWQQHLTSQHKELPELKAMLEAMPVIPAQEEPGTLSAEKALQQELLKQQKAMDQLNLELELQQCRLTNERSSGPTGKITLFCTQDILRQQILDVQKRYEDLKRSMLNLLPPAI